MKAGAVMKITNKLIEVVRIRRDRAERLKNKALEITITLKEQVHESDLVNFLIDSQLDKIKVTRDGVLYLDDQKK